MEPTNLFLKVDPQLTFNVNTQIKEQLKWLIGIGKMQPGDMLPAASQLADTLGLNRNTVNWVYNQMRDEGIVTMQKGKGTHVAGSKETEQLRKERLPMQRLLDEAIEGAQAEGIPLKQLFMSGLAYTLLDNVPVSLTKPIWLVECGEHDHPFYSNAIRTVTGREVRIVFMEELRESGVQSSHPMLQGGDIVATLNHAEEVKALLSPFDKKVHVIGAAVEPSVLIGLAKLEQNTPVSFVCLGKDGGEWMARRVIEAGIVDIHSEGFGIQDQARLEEALDRSAKIYASSAIFQELKKRLPDKVELYPMRLEQSSESLLRALGEQL